MVGVTIPVPQYPLTTTLTLLPNHSLIPDNSKLTLPALLSSVLYNTLDAVPLAFPTCGINALVPYDVGYQAFTH